jgi:hypothetical protein
MPDALRKTLWFIGLWLAGVGTLAVVAMMIRAMIF